MASPHLEALFYAGAHVEVLKATIDSTLGHYAEEDLFLVIGALVFTGRTDEAAIVFRTSERAQDGPAGDDQLEVQAASRFFLCIASCRTGRYAAAANLSRTTLRELRGRASPRSRYYLHQGLGLVRHFEGRIASAARHASRARRFAVESKFSYGRMLALDLLGHTLVQRGKVLGGLTLLAQAAELAEGIGLESFSRTTRSALVAYRAQFGVGEPNPTASLREHLEHVGGEDRYSRRLMLTELAKAYALRGEADAAARELRNAEDVALPDGDRRATVKLLIARALVDGLARGESAALAWLGQARDLVDSASDAALAIDIAWCEYLVAPSVFGERPATELAKAARTTGIARADYLAAARGVAVRSLAGEDRFAAAFRTIRQNDDGLGHVLAHELFGLIPLCFARAPGLAIYLDVERRVLALECYGNVTRREPPSQALRQLLRALADGPRTKEDLIREVWGLKVYRPAAHDAVIHTAISRLRTSLEPFGSWVTVTDSGYGLAPGVAFVERGDEREKREGVVDVPAAPAAPGETGDARRALVLDLVLQEGGMATRQVAESLKVSEMTAFRILSSLVEEHRIERVGRGRNTRYVKPQ